MNDHRPNRFDPRPIAAGISLVLIVPAALFFVAVIGRSFQPVANEPSRTLNGIAEAFLALPPVLAAAAIVAAPLVALSVAAIVVWRTAVTDETLRRDVQRLAEAAVPLLHRPTLLVAIAVVVIAAGMTGILVVHGLAD